MREVRLWKMETFRKHIYKCIYIYTYTYTYFTSLFKSSAYGTIHILLTDDICPSHIHFYFYACLFWFRKFRYHTKIVILHSKFLLRLAEGFEQYLQYVELNADIRNL